MDSSLKPIIDPGLLDGKSLRFLQRLPTYYNEFLINAVELRQIHLDSPSTWPTPSCLQNDAGGLSRLPLETLMMVLKVTPIMDLFRLRATNSYLKHLIEE